MGRSGRAGGRAAVESQWRGGGGGEAVGVGVGRTASAEPIVLTNHSGDDLHSAGKKLQGQLPGR